MKFKRGIFIAPSLLTTCSIFCGFYSIIATINGRFYEAAVAIIVAGFFDIFDGRVARLMHSSSEFGFHLDTLADVISFGLAPSILIYSWVLKPFGRLGWMAAFLYVICGVMRLARFNTQKRIAKTSQFIGLPIPAAAGLIASTVVFTRDIFSIEKLEPIVILGLAYLLAFLMVSNIKYPSFKNVDLRDKKPFKIFFYFVLIVYIIATIPQISFFLIGVTYLLSGPFQKIFSGKMYHITHPFKNIKGKH